MTQLRVFPSQSPDKALLHSEDFDIIQATLAAAGIALERWPTSASMMAEASAEQILAAYAKEIRQLVERGGYQNWDVVSMQPDHPDKASLRQKFLDEHTHAEDEVRFFVRGRGLFSLHIDGQVYELLCTAGDLIRVPAGTKHWFDMGPQPDFTAIRLFNNPQGWVAQNTGDPIAQNFSRLSA